MSDRAHLEGQPSRYRIFLQHAGAPQVFANRAHRVLKDRGGREAHGSRPSRCEFLAVTNGKLIHQLRAVNDPEEVERRVVGICGPDFARQSVVVDRVAYNLTLRVGLACPRFRARRLICSFSL